VSTSHIEQGDGLAWLRDHPAAPRSSVVTSLPDASELPGLTFADWRSWFVSAAQTVIRWLPDAGVAIFYQSDTLHAGGWVDKGHLIMNAADAEAATLVWHKIVCRRPPGTRGWGRASYSHLLCVTRGEPPAAQEPLPDVLPGDGSKSWTRGMGSAACELACQYLRANTDTQQVVDPFCGRGSVLAIASALDFDVVGVELSARRCRIARTAIANKRIITP
jgi:hypothetical protein